MLPNRQDLVSLKNTATYYVVLEFEKYAECPSFVQEKVIKERQEKLKEKEA